MPDITSELKFRFSRSGGAGGQNVNKVSTRVEARFNVANSALLTAQQTQRLLLKLAGRIDKNGWLAVVVNEERSQLQNKKIAIARIQEIVTAALHIPKKRRPTRVTKGAKERRLKAKKQQAEKKQNRQKPE